jgi:hypothetical protein
MIKNKVTTKLANAYDSKLADVVKTITLKKINNAAGYDPATGAITESTVEYTTRGAVVSFENSEIDNISILNTDTQVIIIQDELSAIPEVDDILSFDGGDHKIVGFKPDPSGATWMIQCRS